MNNDASGVGGREPSFWVGYALAAVTVAGLTSAFDAEPTLWRGVNLLLIVGGSALYLLFLVARFVWREIVHAFQTLDLPMTREVR